MDEWFLRACARELAQLYFQSAQRPLYYVHVSSGPSFDLNDLVPDEHMRIKHIASEPMWGARSEESQLCIDSDG